MHEGGGITIIDSAVNFRESGVLYVAVASRKTLRCSLTWKEGTVKQVYTITALGEALPSHALITAMVVRDGIVCWSVRRMAPFE